MATPTLRANSTRSEARAPIGYARVRFRRVVWRRPRSIRSRSGGEWTLVSMAWNLKRMATKRATTTGTLYSALNNSILERLVDRNYRFEGYNFFEFELSPEGNTFGPLVYHLRQSSAKMQANL